MNGLLYVRIICVFFSFCCSSCLRVTDVHVVHVIYCCATQHMEPKFVELTADVVIIIKKK